MIKFILMDIEGTTTAISFVHEVLFPYASAHLENYIQAHTTDPRVLAELKAVKQTVLEEKKESISNEQAIRQLLTWIKEDRKHTALKNLQGYLWKEGYKKGEYRGHIYDDVLPVIKNWKAAGIQMGIYSSGSVEAQQLLFGFSDKGDLTPYFSAYFDTQIGHKREKQSYQNIQKRLNLPADTILFLSDVEPELDAAKLAGFKTIQIVRPGTPPTERHSRASDFRECDSILKPS